MKKKTVSGILLTLPLVTMLALAFRNVKGWRSLLGWVCDRGIMTDEADLRLEGRVGSCVLPKSSRNYISLNPLKRRF